jgi:protein tyrosine/serine phosphatase
LPKIISCHSNTGISEETSMKIRRRQTIKVTAFIVCTLVAIVLTRLWYLEEQGNFHAITPGEAYRSAQMDQDELEHYIHKFKIRSILNLTGNNTGKSWYDEEIAISSRMGIRHFDVELSSDKIPNPSEMEELIRLFHVAPRPILIHCHAGADRGGLASALWKVEIDGEPIEVARQQLSIRFGHMPFGPTQVLDKFFDDWMNLKRTSKKFSTNNK